MAQSAVTCYTMWCTTVSSMQLEVARMSLHGTVNVAIHTQLHRIFSIVSLVIVIAKLEAARIL